jgi:hypothetical protein
VYPYKNGKLIELVERGSSFLLKCSLDSVLCISIGKPTRHGKKEWGYINKSNYKELHPSFTYDSLIVSEYKGESIQERAWRQLYGCLLHSRYVDNQTHIIDRCAPHTHYIIQYRFSYRTIVDASMRHGPEVIELATTLVIEGQQDEIDPGMEKRLRDKYIKDSHVKAILYDEKHIGTEGTDDDVRWISVATALYNEMPMDYHGNLSYTLSVYNDHMGDIGQNLVNTWFKEFDNEVNGKRVENGGKIIRVYLSCIQDNRRLDQRHGRG